MKTIHSIHIYLLLCFFAGMFLLPSCNVTKNIPEGKYLVDRVSVHVDNRRINSADLYDFVIQKPNNQKFRIFWYNWAGSDSTWLKRVARRIGQEPVIYDPKLTALSAGEISAEMSNKGYLQNVVDVETDATRRKKRIRIDYLVTANEPHRIRNYTIDMPEARLDSIINLRSKRGRSILGEGTIFAMSLLEEERTQVSSMLRNRGYFTSTRNNFHFLADTTIQNNLVDLTLIFNDSVVIRPYHIRNVTIRSGFDPLANSTYKVVDSIDYEGVKILYDDVFFMRPRILFENVLIRPGQLYSERRSVRTYNYLMALGSIGRVNVHYTEVDSTLLDCRIDITPADIHEIQLGLDGTNKAGNLGIAGRIGYTHYNIFGGAEALSIRLRGAYEFISNTNNSNILTNNFYEVGTTVELMFPNVHLPFIRDIVKERLNVQTVYNIGFDVQQRPEYTRNFFNIGWRNRWENERRTMNHSLSFVDINYVMMPRISAEFLAYLDQQLNSLTKFSYDNVFTAGLSYSLVYTNARRSNNRRLYTLRFNAESSGNLLAGIFSLTGAQKSPQGQYNILGNPFAQYVKGDLSYAKTIKIDRRNSFAYFLMGGIAYPYGNSTVMDTLSGIKSSILPFEKRYHSGGPNGVRGWGTRQLGPGSYNGDISNPATHIGDIKLDASAEFRYKIINWLEFAYFVDAGNIWTLFSYDNQVGGQFDINRFYKEIAIGTGIGLRLNLNVLIIRLDAAKRVYDPAKEEGNRWTFFTESLRGNSGIYFAIGYPF